MEDHSYKTLCFIRQKHSKELTASSGCVSISFRIVYRTVRGNALIQFKHRIMGEKKGKKLEVKVLQKAWDMAVSQRNTGFRGARFKHCQETETSDSWGKCIWKTNLYFYLDYCEEAANSIKWQPIKWQKLTLDCQKHLWIEIWYSGQTSR